MALWIIHELLQHSCVNDLRFGEGLMHKGHTHSIVLDRSMADSVRIANSLGCKFDARRHHQMQLFISQK